MQLLLFLTRTTLIGVPDPVQGKAVSSVLESVDGSSTLTREQFTEMLRSIDAGLRALPATAQVGTEGEGASSGNADGQLMVCQAHAQHAVVPRSLLGPGL